MRVIALLPICGLVGCAAQNVAPTTASNLGVTPPMGAASATAIGFRCLPNGTVQSSSNGGTISWLGYDPAHPDICIGRNARGAPVQWIRNMYSLSTIWPDSMAAVRKGMADLTTNPVGLTTTFTVTGNSGNPNELRPGTWVHTLRVIGIEAITVPAGRYDANVIDDDERTASGNGHWQHRYWVDRASGAFLKKETIASTSGPIRGWETTSLKSPN